MRTKRYHILVDIEGYNPRLVNKKLLEKILRELPPLINMQVVKGPVVVEGSKENPGMSGFVIIDFSHISIHTFSVHNEMLVDVFSCKAYNLDVVVDFILKEMRVNRAKVTTKTVAWG